MSDEVVLTEEQEEAIFQKRLLSMSNESLAKHLLTESMRKLAMLLKDDMATAADYNVIRAILKDNNIGIVPTRDNAAGKLEEQLKSRAAMHSTHKNIIPVDELTEVDISDFMARH